MASGNRVQRHGDMTYNTNTDGVDVYLFGLPAACVRHFRAKGEARTKVCSLVTGMVHAFKLISVTWTGVMTQILSLLRTGLGIAKHAILLLWT